jgi:hypothetical protein
MAPGETQYDARPGKINSATLKLHGDDNHSAWWPRSLNLATFTRLSHLNLAPETRQWFVVCFDLAASCCSFWPRRCWWVFMLISKFKQTTHYNNKINSASFNSTWRLSKNQLWCHSKAKPSSAHGMPKPSRRVQQDTQAEFAPKPSQS